MSADPVQISVTSHTLPAERDSGDPTTSAQEMAKTLNKRQRSAEMVEQLSEANRSFTYRNKPIHPLAVKELLVWMSDAIDQPGPIAIDLHGTYDTNRYYGEAKKDHDGSISIGIDNEGYFGYQRLGSLKDNLQVVETWENTGGSGVFTNLLLIKFNIDYEYDEQGSRRYRLVMQRMGEIPLSDRYSGKITIQPQDNSIRIGAGVYPSREKIPASVIIIH